MLNTLCPTRADYDAETRAIDRDLIDEERLENFVALVTGLLDRLIPDLHRLGHPEARWHPQDLADALSEQLVGIQTEQRRLRGPLVLDHE